LVVGGGFVDFLTRHPEVDTWPQYAAFYSEADRRALRALSSFATRKPALFANGLANARQAVRALSADGARIVAGTDAPIFPYGLSLLAELDALHAAGLSPSAVLRAATTDAADALGVGHELGRVIEGAHADLLVVAGDPLADPITVRNLRWLIRAGELLDPEQLRR
jgi:imidazolonepropionase-like amidohydrolase